MCFGGGSAPLGAFSLPSTLASALTVAAFPLYSFLRKRSSRSEHMPNRRLAGRPRRNLLLERKSPGLGAPRLVNGGAEEPRRVLCTCRPRNRDHEILTSVRSLSLSLLLPRPRRLSLAPSTRDSSVQNSARVCAHGQCSCAIWDVAPERDPRSVQILGLIQSAAFRLSRSADVYSWFRNFA